jgi:hypothetical protein
MAFTSTIVGLAKFGSRHIVMGNWSTDTTGGTIVTGLRKVEFIACKALGSLIVADAPTVNATLPQSGGDVTVICTSGKSGVWYAVGKQ